MKRLFCLFLLCGIFASSGRSASKVLIVIKEGSPQLEYMLKNEVGTMSEVLKGSGFEVRISTISGEELKAGSVSVKPDLKLSEVKIDDYAGFLFPCMVLDTADPEIVAFIKAAAEKGKPIGAQAGSVLLLAKAGLLNGRKYSLNGDASTVPDFQGGIYSGRGVVTDGRIITSGICPWISKETGWQDGTPQLTQTLIDLINGKINPQAYISRKNVRAETDTLKLAILKVQSQFKDGKTD